MKTIWKYDIPISAGWHKIDMPLNAEIVHVGQQRSDKVTFWAEVLTNLPTVTRRFGVFGTGTEIHNDMPIKYRGTSTTYPLVWHLYEEVV